MFKKCIAVSSKSKYISWKDKSEVKDAEMGPSEGGQMMQGGRKKNQRQRQVLLLIISRLLPEPSALDYVHTIFHKFCV